MERAARVRAPGCMRSANAPPPRCEPWAGTGAARTVRAWTMTWAGGHAAGAAGRVTDGSPAGLHAQLVRDCGFVPPLAHWRGVIRGGDTGSGPGRKKN